MDGFMVDSQATAMEIVPDSQQHHEPDRNHLSANMKLAVAVIIGVISVLVEIISEGLDAAGDWDDSPPVTPDRLHQATRSLATIHLSNSSIVMDVTLTIFRLLCLIQNYQPMRRINCQWYIKPRSTEWFYLFMNWSPNDDPERFREFFRITPDMFTQLCELVRDDMMSHAPQTFHYLPNRNLTVERQVALAIRRLAIGDQLLGIAKLFGVSLTTANKVTWKFCKSLCHRARQFLKWPQGPAMEQVKNGFSERWGFPNCCGAIDATHFVIELPQGENPSTYYDWKHNLSCTMQAIVDNQCQFMDVLIGALGSMQDSRVLRTSCFYQNVVYEGSKLHGPAFRTPSGYALKEYVLGDAGYPLYNWLIVPYHRNQSPEKDLWNQRHSSARMCVERSFGRLKGMWRILSRVMLRPKLDRLPRTVLSCVLLHNMIIQRGDEVAPQVWNDVPVHPEGYANRPQRNQEMFDGGAVAREELQQTVMAQDAP